jgi:predicted ATPase
MKLEKLTIKSRFKNLSNFTINFAQETTVIVGKNGTGKSNLLEALTIIFRDLDLGESPAFAYDLDYICRDKKIHIDADPERKQTKKEYEISVNGESLSFSKFHKDPERKYLPTYVFGYYSGPSNRMEEHFLKHQEKFYKELLRGKDKPLRPFFFAKPVHSQFVLLAFFIEDDSEVLKFLDEYLWIEALNYVLFVMREPPWESTEGDKRFWNARGVVGDFLDKLYQLSLAPLRLSQSVDIRFRKKTTLEHLYLYIKSLEDIRALAQQYESQQEFFKALESTYISELMSEVRISVKARKIDGSLTFRELSEGEQQLLMVLGLLRFTREEESLFLLDEPDTHLNPVWSINYLKFLREIGGTQENSHIIMTTHDPLVMVGLERTQTIILVREENTGQIIAQLPDDDPRGMGVGGLMTSDLIGLRSQLDPVTLKKLDRQTELSARLSLHGSLSDEEHEELRDLTEELSNLGFNRTFRDPLEQKFTEALYMKQKEEGLNKTVLTKEEQEDLDRLAMEILTELKSED